MLECSCMYDLLQKEDCADYRDCFIAFRVVGNRGFLYQQEFGACFLSWNSRVVFTLVLLSFPEWGHYVCLWLAGIQRCVNCLQPLRCAAGCLPWITGEPLEIPLKKHQAFLMPLISFFSHSCSPFPKSSPLLKFVLLPSYIHIPVLWCLLAERKSMFQLESHPSVPLGISWWPVRGITLAWEVHAPFCLHQGK